MNTRPRSLASRLVIAAILWIAAALAIGGLLISALFRDSVERNFDTRLTVHVDSLIAVSRYDDSGRLILSRTLPEPRFDLPYSGWYWQISDQRGAALVRSRSLWDQTLDISAPGEQGGMRTEELPGPDGAMLRVRFIDVTLPEMPPDAPPVRFAVAADRRELKDELRPFNLALLWSMGALGLGLAAAVAIQVRFGLQPLRRVRIALADIRGGRTERMEGDWPSEVQPLVSELDSLLEHNAAVLDRARTHVGNLAHALKTPLAVLGNEASRSRGPRADAIDRQVVTMRRWVDHYLSRARAAATGAVLGARTPVAPVIGDLKRTLERIHADRSVEIVAQGEDGSAAFRGEREDLEEMIGNLLDNACKWAASRVTVSTAHKDGQLVVTIDDDGAGLPASQHGEAIGRGRRLDETSPGSGLGLAIVSEIAGLYGGELQLDESPMGGLRAELTLPLAAEPD
ncbi:MAG: sensor histidine kinase [Alphaproteobacteria bacterium]|nr:sensor histidine kinase [Alphaproteobacteria bacterium]